MKKHREEFREMMIAIRMCIIPAFIIMLSSGAIVLGLIAVSGILVFGALKLVPLLFF